MTGRRFWYALGAIALVGWLVRVVYIWSWRRDPTTLIVQGQNDSAYYHHASRLLADGKGFLNPFFSTPDAPYQSADHPPAYQLFLAVFARVGLDTPTQQMLLTATFIGTPTIWLAGLAGRRIAGPTTALVAAGLVAVAPNVFSWDGMLLSESAALFAVTLTIWAGYRYWQAPSTRAGVALAAAAALAAMCRAELVLLGLFVVVPLLVRHGERGTRAIARRVGAGAVAAMVVIGPWVGYNLTRFEHPVYLSVGAEITLASATCEQTYYGEGTGYWSYFCARDVRDQIRREFPPRLETIDGVEREVPQLDQSEEAPYFRTYATDYIRDHIGRFPVVVAARWGRVLYLWNPAHVVRADTFPEGRDPGIAQWGRWTFYPLALLAIGGAVTLRRRRVPVYPVAAVFLTVGAAVTLAFGTPRYRASAETALCLLAAVGITALAETLAARRARTPDSPADAPVA